MRSCGYEPTCPLCRGRLLLFDAHVRVIVAEPAAVEWVAAPWGVNMTVMSAVMSAAAHAFNVALAAAKAILFLAVTFLFVILCALAASGG